MPGDITGPELDSHRPARGSSKPGQGSSSLPCRRQRRSRLHLRPAVHEHECRSGAGTLQQWNHRGHHHRIVALAHAISAFPLGFIPVSRSCGRHEAGRARAECPLRRRRKHQAHRRSHPHYGSIDRRGFRQSHLGRKVRRQCGGCFFRPGPSRAEDRQYARREGTGCRHRAGAPQAAVEPGGLRIRPEGQCFALGRSGGQRRGHATSRGSDKAGPRLWARSRAC